MSMHEARLALAIESVLEAEGGYKAPEPGDPNPTNWGITASTLEWARSKSRVYPTNVVHLSRDSAVGIYELYLTRSSPYHDITKVKPLVPMVMLAHCEVLMGRSAGVRVLQRALNFIGDDVDGKIGPNTMWAIKCIEPYSLVSNIQDRWIGKLYRIIDANPDKARFRDGWINRASGWREGFRP